MKDPYVYEGTNVLKNKFGIRDENELAKAEADYSSFRIRSVLEKPIQGIYDFYHFCQYHKFIFGDVYDWAGAPRIIDIEKAEKALGGWSIEYCSYENIQLECNHILNEIHKIKWDILDIPHRVEAFTYSLAKLWKIHAFREGNTRTAVTFMCQLYESQGYLINRSLFEQNSAYVRNALVAYNATFKDIGDISRPEYLLKIVTDALESGAQTLCVQPPPSKGTPTISSYKRHLKSNDLEL